MSRFKARLIAGAVTVLIIITAIILISLGMFPGALAPLMGLFAGVVTGLWIITSEIPE